MMGNLVLLGLASSLLMHSSSACSRSRRMDFCSASKLAWVASKFFVDLGRGYGIHCPCAQLCAFLLREDGSDVSDGVRGSLHLVGRSPEAASEQPERFTSSLALGCASATTRIMKRLGKSQKYESLLFDDGSGKMRLHHRKVHKYLGMNLCTMRDFVLWVFGSAILYVSFLY
jgi:hypothetical protein